MTEDTEVVGALVGWRKVATDHGIMLRMQVASSRADFENNEFKAIDLALNDRQIRSLTRDLIRAADYRRIELRPKRRWSQWLRW